MKIHDAFISNLNGGNAGDGGSGRVGGNANVDNDFQPKSITAGKVGDGGAGGNSGNGGNVIAVKSDKSSSTMTENVMTKNLTGGNFGDDGSGGSGGRASTIYDGNAYPDDSVGYDADDGKSGQAGDVD